MSRRRKIAILLAVVITLAWAILFGAFLSLQGFPSLLEVARDGARARVGYWGVWLAGVAAGVAFIIALWRSGRAGMPSARETRMGAVFLVAGTAVWTALIVAALVLEAIIYPGGEFGAALEPYPTLARLLLVGGWLIGVAVAARLLVTIERERRSARANGPRGAP